MIEFRNVTKKFGEQTILKNLNLKIEEGKILFILGTSGTGKSVLLKNIVGLMRPESGQILIDSEDVSNFSEEDFFAIRKKCGMVFQQPALFDSLNVFENIAFGLRRQSALSELEITEKVRQALQLVHLTHVEQKWPAELSFGMQKRVSLARTLALNPKVLLFDEPTTGLDPLTTKAINQLIQELSKKLNTTSVVVSHDMNCALEIADRIVVLDRGEIVEQGSPKDLEKSKVPLVQDFLRDVMESDNP